MNKRNNGIDLLRIVSMFFIVIHHLYRFTIYPNEYGTINYWFFMFFDSFAGIADNAFALISGYCSGCNENNKLPKIIYIWLQAFFYSFGFIMIYKLFNLGSYGIKDIIKSMMPVTFSNCWYLTCYIALLFLMPFIDKLLNSLTKNEMKHFLVIIFIVFSFYNFFFDSFDFRYGLSVIWLCFLYIIGNIIKRLNLFTNIKISILVVATIISISFTSIVSEYFDMAQFKRPICPTQLISAICILIIFSRINIKHNFSKKYSSKVFAIYLFHDMSHTLNLISSKLMPLFTNELINNIAILFISTLVIILFSYLIETIRQVILENLNIDNTINKVSSTILYKINKFL